MRRFILLFITVLSLASCNANLPAGSTAPGTADQVTVEFLSAAELWPTADVVRQKEDYYLQNEPEYFKNSGTETSYLQSLTDDGDIHFWKVGTIINGNYAGQSLVLAKEYCGYYRYAVDESNYHWTALLSYSSDSTQTEAGPGPADAQEASIDIPSLNPPDTLSLYANDSTYFSSFTCALDPTFYGEIENATQTKAVFDQTYHPVTFADSSFSHYFKEDGASCVYGETPDGVLVSYLVMPTIFGPFTQDPSKPSQILLSWENYNFNPTEGESEQEKYTFFAGECGDGRVGPCLPTSTPAAGEESQLKEAGTLDGRLVYQLPVAAIPEVDAPGLTHDLVRTYNYYIANYDYKMKAQKEPSNLTIAQFLTTHKLLFVKLDDGSYTLLYDTLTPPDQNCGSNQS